MLGGKSYTAKYAAQHLNDRSFNQKHNDNSNLLGISLNQNLNQSVVYSKKNSQQKMLISGHASQGPY